MKCFTEKKKIFHIANFNWGPITVNWTVKIHMTASDCQSYYFHEDQQQHSVSQFGRLSPPVNSLLMSVVTQFLAEELSLRRAVVTVVTACLHSPSAKVHGGWCSRDPIPV